jgi:hypothetical protein
MLKDKLRQQISDYKKLSSEYKDSKNLAVYIDTYEQVIEFES